MSMTHPWVYFELGGDFPGSQPLDRQAEAIWASLALSPGNRVLEIGAGRGRHLAALAEWGAKVVGLERSAALVQHCLQLGLEVHEGDARRMPVFDWPFDACVIGPGVLGSMDGHQDDLLVLTGALSALRPDGRLLVIAPHVSVYMEEASFNPSTCRFIMAHEGSAGSVAYRQRAFHHAELVHLLRRAGGRPLAPAAGPLGAPMMQRDHQFVVALATRAAVPEPSRREARDEAWYSQFFKDMGSEYLEYRFAQGTVAEVEVLKEQLRLAPGQRILDVGCGVGRHALALAHQGFAVQGYDLSPAMIDVARSRAEAEGLPARFGVSDVRDLPSDESFDAAYCVCEGGFGLLENDIENLAVLRSVYRSLKPGGSFFLTALNLLRMIDDGSAVNLDTGVESWKDAPRAQPDLTFTGHNRAYLYPELAELLREVGFQVEEPSGHQCFGRALVRVVDMELNVVGRKPRPESR